MRAARRGFLLYLALLSLGAGGLASCAPENVPPPRTSAVSALPAPAPEKEVPSPPLPRPARKPAPPEQSEEPASAKGDGGELHALAPSQPPAGATTPEGFSQAGQAPPVSPASGPTGPVAPQASELIGLDQPAATRLFGSATEQSEEPPATVWRYKTATCELDLLFYLDVRSGRMRTLHYRLRGDGADAGGRENCLRSLVASHRG